jgi:adenine/guanine phosphoribosyltransferase-like PRPP-binding protein
MIQLERVSLEHYGGERTSVMLHSLAGIHMPLRFEDLVQELRPLARKVRAQQGDIVVGLDGPGMVPALALAHILHLPVMFATKMDLARSPKYEFAEPLSPRPRVFLYGIRPRMSVILVDDGITTGKTLASCIETLRAARVSIRAVIVLVESGAHDARERIRELGVSLLSLVRHDDA